MGRSLSLALVGTEPRPAGSGLPEHPSQAAVWTPQSTLHKGLLLWRRLEVEDFSAHEDLEVANANDRGTFGIANRMLKALEEPITID